VDCLPTDCHACLCLLVCSLWKPVCFACYCHWRVTKLIVIKMVFHQQALRSEACANAQALYLRRLVLN
jgi:hypothetical protein